MCDSTSLATCLTVGQKAFFESENVWHESMSVIPDLQYRGKEVIKGDEFAASKNFKVNQKNSRAIEETAKKMNLIQYDQIHMLTEKKKQ